VLRLCRDFRHSWGGEAVSTKVAITTAICANKMMTFIRNFIPMTIDPNFTNNRDSKIHFDTDSSKSTSFNL